MHYYSKLISRMLMALVILIIPINIFYVILSKPTLIFSYQFLTPFYEIELLHNGLITNNTFLEFIPACIASSAYYLLALIILLTKDIDFKKGISMFLLGSVMIFAMNIFRIDFLIYLLFEYGWNYFNTLHLFFWKILSSLYVVSVWVFLSYRFSIKTIPVYSDLKYLYKRSIFHRK